MTTDANAGADDAVEQLAEDDRAAAAALIRAVTEADGVSPVSEDGRLALAHGRPGARHLVRRSAGSIAGYLYLGPAEARRDGVSVQHAAEPRIAELCVAPEARRRGVGRGLIEAALAATVSAHEPVSMDEQPETASALQVWAHGSLPAAAAAADRLGFTAVRELRLMELALSARTAPDLAPPARPTPPDGVTLSTFRPGEDEDTWLALNARAFAHHPEQGLWTGRDLAQREAEPWFDPAGFFLARAAGPAGAAQQAGAAIGFHWTKVHPAGAYGPRPVGEIYVLGVDPGAGRRGLGRYLALVGLHHLAQSGLDTVILYVDGDNTAAVRLYESLGFHNRAVDTLYERRAPA